MIDMTAAVANEGYYYTPHIIKKIDGDTIDVRFKTPIKTSIDSTHFKTMNKALYRVFKSGTGKLLNVPGIEICGKSGTVENFTKINGIKTQLSDHSIFIAYAPKENPTIAIIKTQLSDHSIFIAYAPKENPTIAISVLVENAGYGSVWAGRIASLMIEKYINDNISLKKMEKIVLNKNLEKEYLKPYLSKSFNINE